MAFCFACRGLPLLSALLLLLLLPDAGSEQFQRRRMTHPNDLVHIFYYVWYGNPSTDGKYLHWNHEVLPSWRAGENARFPQVGKRFSPPQHPHSPFYPARGCYSSRDPQLLKDHFLEIKGLGISVVVVSWWGRAERSDAADTQGVKTDEAMAAVMAAAEGAEIKVAFHLEPYAGRTAATVREDLRYIKDTYGSSPAVFRVPATEGGKPLYYVYDSYHIPSRDWATVLTAGGASTVRGTDLDGIFIGLWLDRPHGSDLYEGGFDGFYTYFASTYFSYGSTPANWPYMAKFAADHNKLFVASVGPGYNDTGIRPWNAQNTKARNGGDYYRAMFTDAIDAKPDYISITSYNEWGEGTQVEPAVPYSTDYGFSSSSSSSSPPPPSTASAQQDQRAFADYGGAGEGDKDLYLRLTSNFVANYVASHPRRHETERAPHHPEL